MASQELLLPDLRIVLIGKVGDEKTSVMNSFLRSSEGCDNPASECQKIIVSETEKCQREDIKIRGQKVVVIDTPGLCSEDKEDEEVVKEIKECVSLADPGPHVFLFVLSCLDRFTDEEQGMVDIIKKTFGENVTSYTMVVFTHADKLNGEKISKFVGKSEDLKRFVSECKDRCHPFDNQDQNQVFSLLKSIDTMVQENEKMCYTTDMLQKAVSDGKGAQVMKKITLSVNACGVAGAVLGGTVSHFVGSPVGAAGGAVAGGAAGITLGGAGILAAEHMKAKRCMIQ